MNILRLNINIGGRPSPGFDGEEYEFTKLAALVGGAIPKSYVDLLRIADGGHPEIGSCHPEDVRWGSELFDLDTLFSLENPKVETVWSAHKRYGKLLGIGCLPLGCTGGDDQVYIDLNSSEKSIWLYIHDRGNERYKLSDNLEKYIKSLVPNPDFI